ncbi:hypothetical protein GRAN_5104 [Granulicella sibirica]|uniref:Uncharacterized protein n=1 Tax=Granulicella sibirica TaxID=2479048 RepID=A0A4Q0SXN4_9BACT|nr:hypothetical protein GRAN_5104 [Granulicella sibirica]
MPTDLQLHGDAFGRVSTPRKAPATFTQLFTDHEAASGL